MTSIKSWRTVLAGSACGAVFCTGAYASEFNIPSGDLSTVLSAFSTQTGTQIVMSYDAVKGVQSHGVKGNVSPDEALSRLLSGTGFAMQRRPSGAIAIVRERASLNAGDPVGGALGNDLVIAQAAPARSAVETVTVTSSKLGGADVQSIPIAITALSQEQLTASQTAGGPDLVKQVPNLTFTKTNFAGYSIQIRGIGTQAISVSTDPAVAVAFNDTPFLRNHFFEQEFYDVSQVEVVRGPQGTLYGRNATAGVVNLISARPTDQFEALASAELGNYHQRRFEGMLNIPVVDDRLDIRAAGEWTKRQGYSFNSTTGERIDGRDLWSGRLTIAFKPNDRLAANLIWEHFSESDDRLRSSKQLCKTDPGPTELGGVAVPGGNTVESSLPSIMFLSQGCLPSSLYSAEAFEVPNGYSLPYYSALPLFNLGQDKNPYQSATQSQNLRIIESSLDPTYKAKNDIVQLNVDYALLPSVALVSQTAFNHDLLYSIEDYNRFAAAPQIFAPGAVNGAVRPDGVFCDPQLNCSDRLLAEDRSDEHSWQLGQEFRLTSSFSGPFNFSAGVNSLHYETEESYYVFINSITLVAIGNPNSRSTQPWVPGVSDNSDCLPAGLAYNDPNKSYNFGCSYIDPNPVDRLNNEGHNYFLSQNPYVLNSYAAFGEVYYNLRDDLKLTAGLRWTEDQKHFVLMPSWIAVEGYGYPVAGAVDQRWDQFTGRLNVTWTPKVSFTDQTLIYGSYAHGYKAGGANPPGAAILQALTPVHPLTFKPEFVDAFELGTKNTLLDGAITLNGNVFYYDYRGYQISQIVDRTSINLNFDAHIKGAEFEAAWEPIPGLRFNFGGGYEDTALSHGSSAIDLIDRTAGVGGWSVVKPFITQASNCVVPTYVLEAELQGLGGSRPFYRCNDVYDAAAPNLDPVTQLPYVPDPTIRCTNYIARSRTCRATAPISGYAGFDPASAPNGGAGFSKDLSGNELPNAPPFTVSFGAQFTRPISSEWAATLHSDFYWQDSFWARVFNDDPYDRIRGYTNLNIALILTNQSGWQIMLYDKNVFNTTAITGDFLNSDDTGLATNVFLTDPRLIGIRVTKNW